MQRKMVKLTASSPAGEFPAPGFDVQARKSFCMGNLSLPDPWCSVPIKRSLRYERDADRQCLRVTGLKDLVHPEESSGKTAGDFAISRE